MTDLHWFDELLADLKDQHLTILRHSDELRPAKLIEIAAASWPQALAETQFQQFRFVALWAEQVEQQFRVNACVEKHGSYLVFRCELPIDKPSLYSITPYFANANRPERHAQDLFGIEFEHHPQAQRWTRHQAWGKDDYPLRKDFPVHGRSLQQPTPPDAEYPFLSAQGNSVYEIPVGPVHAGIIEPGHFRFQAVGETVLNLEEHLGYVHKGVEKIAEGRDAEGLLRLAGRVSGDSCVAHAWAACQALERAAQIEPPRRALVLRAILAERERVANHLGDVGAICNDVAFAHLYYQFGRLRELWQRLNARIFGHRLLMDLLIPGGVKFDLDDLQIQLLRQQCLEMRKEIIELRNTLESNLSLEDRLETTGVLSPEIAELLGCVGFVGRASGQDYDVRRDAPYPPYERLEVSAPCVDTGDVAARTHIRLEESLNSLSLIEQLCDSLPTGAIATPWQAPAQACAGIGVIDGWRGEIFSYVSLNADGKVERFFPRDPSWLTWPALELLIRGNIVPDFPVCNKSINGSYSGHDL